MGISSYKSHAGQLAALALAISVLSSCTDTVYRDRPPFNPPPDAASGFLGYFNAADQQTTCGNCHVDHQGKWEKHGHHEAWATLQNSGHAASYCEGCHTVSQNGNAVDTAAGYLKVKDKAYYDVQCESCHGPGETHVTTPDASTPPLARIEADTIGDPANPAPKSVGTCAECHTGAHDPFADQWRLSRHGRANTHASTNASCVPCHEGRGILRAWNVTSNYKEKNDVVDTLNAVGITCAVCHDPHGNDNPGQLRFSISEPTLEGNLCMKCHSRRFELTAANSSPHGPQGAVLLGTAGWWPSGSDTTPQATTHGDPNANPRLCAGCHVRAFTVNDSAGNFVFQSVGHLFRPIPCLDAAGKPLPGEDNSCAYDAASRDWGACLGSGCHSSTGAAVQALSASRDNLKVLVDQLWKDNNANQKIDAGDTGYLTLVASTEFKANDNFISVAEGALFNCQLFGEKLTGHPDNSFGAHNPFLAQRILAASINAVKAQYSLPAPPASVQRIMDEGVAKAKARGAAVPLSVR